MFWTTDQLDLFLGWDFNLSEKSLHSWNSSRSTSSNWDPSEENWIAQKWSFLGHALKRAAVLYAKSVWETIVLSLKFLNKLGEEFLKYNALFCLLIWKPSLLSQCFESHFGIFILQTVLFPGKHAHNFRETWRGKSYSRIPSAVFLIPRPWIPGSTRKNFPDSGIRIPLHWAILKNSPSILKANFSATLPIHFGNFMILQTVVFPGKHPNNFREKWRGKS